MIVNLPFAGFYESVYSEGIDREMESYCEYHADTANAEDEDYEGFWTEALRLSASELADILFLHTDYRAAYQRIAKDYAAAFDYVAGEALGMSRKVKRHSWNKEAGRLCLKGCDQPSIGLTFESMDSPREYNFTTDRIYASVPVFVLRKLFKRSREEKHRTLAAVIKKRFTSYDGFYSFYSNDLGDWLNRPLAEWDHNELGTLLIAALEMSGLSTDDAVFEQDVYDMIAANEGFYTAWSEAVDWKTFDAARADARRDKLEAWQEADSEAAANWQSHNPGLAAALEGNGAYAHAAGQGELSL
ncbi:MAG: hypothetical protein KGI54_14525 [Pseudomonadota bacterium]|nr:hypothetical protein [Pseudomonadota bacterium]